MKTGFALGALLALLALAPAAGAAAPHPYGICSHLMGGPFGGRDKAFAMMNVAGVGMVRCDFRWGAIEKPAGTWNFDRTDAIVADAKAAGIVVLPSLNYGHPDHPAPDVDQGPWREFVHRVAERYANDIPAFEVWNEQNISWKGNPTNYVPVLKAAAEEIRAAAPNAKVVIGGFAGTPFTYMQTLYDLGCRDWFDVMNFHSYWPDPPEGGRDGGFALSISNIRSLMHRNGDGGKPIWLTETGASSAECVTARPEGTDPFATRNTHSVDEATQASHLARILGIAFESGLEVVIPYEMRDPLEGRFEKEAHFGLLHENFVPKPAWCAYAQFIAMRPPESVRKPSKWQQGKNGLWCPQWTRPAGKEPWRETHLPGRDAGMVWSYPAIGFASLKFTAGNVRFFNHLGEELYPERMGDNTFLVRIGDSPTYFVGGELVVAE